MARPTKLTPEIQRTIAERTRAGALPHVAAQSAGIHPSTFRRWMARGTRGDRQYRAFHDEVSQARAEARAAAEIRVYNENPLAYLRYTARSKPEEPGWTETVSHELGGPEGGAIRIEVLDQILKEAGDGDEA